MINQDNPFLLNRSWISSSSDFQDSIKIKILQWNILNPIYTDNDKYPKVSDEYLSFDYRRELIKKEIIQLSPDIVCLQEVNTDSLDYFTSFLGESSGYKSVYTKRQSTAKDGILFASKLSSIDLIASMEGKYLDLETG